MNIQEFIGWIQAHWQRYSNNVMRSSLYQVNELAGEAGELANVVKKICRRRDDEYVHNMTAEERLKLVDECGDVLHCVLRLATDHGITLDEMITRNVAKLTERYTKKEQP